MEEEKIHSSRCQSIQGVVLAWIRSDEGSLGCAIPQRVATAETLWKEKITFLAEHYSHINLFGAIMCLHMHLRI